MSERPTTYPPQAEVDMQPMPYDIYKAAAKLGLQGQAKEKNGLGCYEYTGTFEDQTFSIKAYITPDYEAVEILGPNVDVTIQNLWETEESSAIQYRMLGQPPSDILEILSSLAPQK